MRYKKYSEEFKRDGLRMVADGSRSVAQLERDLGITAELIHNRQRRTQLSAFSALLHSGSVPPLAFSLSEKSG